MFKCKICLSDIDLNLCKKLKTGGMFFYMDLVRYKCPICGVIFGDLNIINLTENQLKDKYIEVSKFYHDGDLSIYEIPVFEKLNPQKDKIYLNYASGEFSSTSDKLRNMGFNVYSYEPHISVNDNEFVLKDIDSLLKYRFDGIFSHNALEHFQDPIKEMKLMKSILKENGCVLHSTQCFNYLYEQSEFHLYFYLDKSPEYLAKNSGFNKVEKIQDDEYLFKI